MRPQLLHALFSNVSGKHRTKTVPPKPYSFVANFDATLVEQVLHIPKRKRETDVHHYRQANDLRARFKVTKGRTFCHPARLRDRPARLNQFSSDSARQTPLPLCEPNARALIAGLLRSR